MAKKITILENAVEKSVSKVAKIKTKLANGRDCYWVPEEDYPLGVLNVTEDGVYNASSDPNGPFYGYSEVNVEGVGNVEMGTLGTITITANGTYEAATDSQGPFYGYSTVIVNVSDEDAAPGHISGKDPDGNDEVVTVDDDGHLVKETVPSSIKIISPPDILTYYDGELIDFHGIYVKGYLEDGTEWGVVPNNELSFPEPIAEWDGGSTQTIPVQWHRPGDDKSLYDNFEITVNKPDDSGGQDPQPAPTPSPD